MDRLKQKILNNLIVEGYVQGTEQYEICNRALQFLSYSYKRSEELEEGLSVDCSTLVSQSHWEGAAIVIPFIAESQRTATSGHGVPSLADMIPGDVLVKYSSLAMSPDKTWNHVGLYLGRDASGEQWLIESTSKTGVRLSRVAEFNPQGGIKRFTLRREAFVLPQSLAALALTSTVPKFGRLGMRQYRKSGGERLYHKGLDLYVPEGTPVHATLAGRVSLVRDSVEQSPGVEIAGNEMTVRYLMIGGVSVQPDSVIHVGDLLGHVIEPSDQSDILYSPMKTGLAHLHLEAQMGSKSANKGENQLKVGNKQYLNHLYLSKVGRLGLPFRS